MIIIATCISKNITIFYLPFFVIKFDINVCSAGIILAHRHDGLFQGISKTSKPLVKSAYRKIDFLISQPNLMLWVLKRTV